MRGDAEAIWRAGVAAVDSETLVKGVVRCDEGRLIVCGHEIELDAVGRIAVVGAGKAGAGMAAGFEAAVGLNLLSDKVFGWVNVPADCVRPLAKIHLHAARPAALNEPTSDGVVGAERILEIVSHLEPNDICVVLLSGGGSALLPAPIEGISLADKQSITRLLMKSGATIGELNCVRKQLSRIKGGRLARATRAGTIISLIISDVVNDPLDIIASGPTTPDTSTPAEALEIVRRYSHAAHDAPTSIIAALERASARPEQLAPFPKHAFHHVIGNNEVALKAAAREAYRRGYEVETRGSNNQGEAADLGRELAQECLAKRTVVSREPKPLCILSGGEPVVHLAKTNDSSKGGRNQELVLAAVDSLWDDGMTDIVILSGGTDGEDGPTDAAGAIANSVVLASARRLGLNPAEFLAINDSYHFFEQCGGLLKTGPTHTNVMDVRVALVTRSTASSKK